MVNVRVGPGRRMRTCWPTLKSYFCAVPRSITTSFGVVGCVPCDDAQGRDLLIGVEGDADPGRSPVRDGLAVRRDELHAVSVTEPSAASTPGTARTVATSDSGTGLRVAVPPLPNWATPRTWKSMFW